jgi:hypothetical protein
LCLFSAELPSFARSPVAGAILFKNTPQAVARSPRKLGGPLTHDPSSSMLAANTLQTSGSGAPKSILGPSSTGPAQPAAQSASTGTAAAPVPTITIPVPNSLPVYQSPAAPKSVLTPTPSAAGTVNLQSASQFFATPGTSTNRTSASAGSSSLSVARPQVNSSTPTTAPAATPSQLNLSPSSSPLSTLPSITSGTSLLPANQRAPSPPSLGPGLGTAAPSSPAKTNTGLMAPTAVSH